MKADDKNVATVLRRALRLSCPVCGQASIARGPFRIRNHCPDCASIFKREEGFFVGAILANMMTTEFVILLASVFGLAWLNYEIVLAGLFLVALIFPVLFYHHSWSLWLGFDHLVEGLPKLKTPRHE